MYGTKVLRKKYGEKQEECPVCHNNKIEYIRTSTWFYLFLPIPLIPVSFKYWKHCEFCDSAQQYKKVNLLEELNKPAEEIKEREPMNLDGDTKNITITRKSRSGKGPALDIYVEKQLVAKLEKNQSSVSFQTDLEPRAMFAKLADRNKVVSNVCFLEELNNNEYEVSVSIDSKEIYLYKK